MAADITSATPVETVIDVITKQPYNGWPKNWHQWENIKEAHRQIIDQFIPTITVPENTGTGRGIVTAGGGYKFFPSLWVLLSTLRDYDNSIPVEVFYKGELELDPIMKRLLRSLGARLVDLAQLTQYIPTRILGGWELKPYVILYSSFKDVMFIDADAIPMPGFQRLFDVDGFKDCGAMFWPDYPTWNLSKEQWETFGIAPPANLVPACSKDKVGEYYGRTIPSNYNPAIESGQLLVDKARCWKALRLALKYCEHADFTFHHIHGDKETFRFAWMKLNIPYTMPWRFPGWCGHTIYQYDQKGDIAFAHRTQDKWQYDFSKNVNKPSVLGNDSGFMHIHKLRSLWGGKMWHNPNPSYNEQEMMKCLAGKYHYTTDDGKTYGIRLHENGKVNKSENTWTVFEDDGEAIIAFPFAAPSDQQPLVLRKTDDNVWRSKQRGCKASMEKQ